MNIWEQSFEDLRRPYLEEKKGKGDGNLANNYPPYDKVTRGDIIAGALGKDQMGGKKKVKEEQEKEGKEAGKDEGGKHKEYKHAPGKEEKGEKKTEKEMKNEERKVGGGMKPGGGYDRGYKAMQKEVEKLDSGKETAAAKRYKETRKEHSDWRSDLCFFTEEDCGCDGPMKPKKGIKNKVTINPELKTEGNLNENPLIGLGIRAGLAAGTALAGKMVYDKAKGVADKLNQRNQQTQKAIDSLKNSYEPEGDELEEVAPPGAKYERMVKHVKKNYPKEKEGIAYATAWKQYNKAKNEEFAGNYEGPLYAPHPDIDEQYKEIDKAKEGRMYRRAGNLARTALSSRGKVKQDAQTKSSKIVSAITRQKENERFYRIGQHPKHNEALENELDYYLGEALRPASERMKRVQTDAGRKKQEKERERKSKLEAEADKILAGFSKKGIGLAKTKPMSEQEDKERRGTDYMGRDYGTGKQNKTIPPEGVMQGGWLEREKKKKKSN